MIYVSKGKANIKEYIMISPDNEEFIMTEGLTKFYEDRNSSASNMHGVLKGKRNHHKW